MTHAKKENTLIEVGKELTDIGRELGSNLLTAITENSSSAKILSSQIYSLKVAALHILAMVIFNEEHLHGKDSDDCLEETCDLIQLELDFVRTCEKESQLVLFTPKSIH